MWKTTCERKEREREAASLIEQFCGRLKKQEAPKMVSSHHKK